MSRDPSLERKFVDSNVFLYVLRADPRYGERTRAPQGSGAGHIHSRYFISQAIAHLERKNAVSAITPFWTS